MRFIDSNVFVRYITLDDASASARAAQIIDDVLKGVDVAFTTDVHAHEVASKSLYSLSHTEIRDRLRPLLLMKNLKVANKQLCLEALEVFAAYQQLDFADALAVASMRRRDVTEIYSFDRDFDRVQDIARVEG